jgi:hypothetical protein
VTCLQEAESSIPGVHNPFLIVKTILLCSADVKLISVQRHSVLFSFSDSALSTLINADRC